jgi:hypothetical protein
VLSVTVGAHGLDPWSVGLHGLQPFRRKVPLGLLRLEAEFVGMHKILLIGHGQSRRSVVAIISSAYTIKRE